MSAELIKEGGETAVTILHQIRVALWVTGDWPEDWTNSIFVPIPKKRQHETVH